MTFTILEDIEATLKKEFAGFKYDTLTDTQEPNVWIGHAPPKKSMPAGAENDTETGDPPFLVVRYLDDEDNDELPTSELEAKVGILCCVYSKDSYEDIKSGYKDIMNMADRVLLALKSKRYWGDKSWWREGAIKRTYGLQKELNSIYQAGQQTHPCYGAAVVATFKMASLSSPIL